MPAYSGNRIDTDLLNTNIKSGIDIFGVTGNYSTPQFSSRTVIGLPDNFARTGSATPTGGGAEYRLARIYEDATRIFFISYSQCDGTGSGVVVGSSVAVIEKSTGNTLHQSTYSSFIGTSGVGVIAQHVFDFNSGNIRSYTFNGIDYYGFSFNITTYVYTTINTTLALPVGTNLTNSVSYNGYNMQNTLITNFDPSGRETRQMAIQYL